MGSPHLKFSESEGMNDFRRARKKGKKAELHHLSLYLARLLREPVGWVIELGLKKLNILVWCAAGEFCCGATIVP
jgi:hypothetical protein